MDYENVNDKVLERQAITYLSILKISPNINGYHYLKSCFKKICYDSSKKFRVNKVLYPEIAEEFNVENNLIDRSMRHAMRMSFKRGGIENMEKYLRLKFSSAIPSPREVLCVLAEVAKKEKRKFLFEIVQEQDKFLQEAQKEYTEFLQEISSYR